MSTATPADNLSKLVAASRELGSCPGPLSSTALGSRNVLGPGVCSHAYVPCRHSLVHAASLPVPRPLACLTAGAPHRDLNGKAASKEATLQTWASGARCISRVPGLAVFLADSGLGLPAGFVALTQSAGVVHHTVVFLTVQQACTAAALLWRLSHMPCSFHLPACMGCACPASCSACTKSGMAGGICWKTRPARGGVAACWEPLASPRQLCSSHMEIKLQHWVHGCAQVALPVVPEEQRWEVTALGARGCYAVLCRLGYADGLKKDAALIDALVTAIAEDIRFAAMVAKCARSAPLGPSSFMLHRRAQHHATFIRRSRMCGASQKGF